MRIYLFKVYERIWHWVQSALVLVLLWTGWVIHGAWGGVGFSKAVALHEAVGVGLLVLSAFTMFWHITTGEGKQFIPRRRGLADMIRFYTGGIFRDAPHPESPSPEAKFNPLQRFAYFGLLVFIFPVQMATGFLLWGLPRFDAFAGLRPHLGSMALIHTAGAYGMMIFILVHLYMITTGRTLGANVKAMWTGWSDES
ncbi:MAG: cytochrome b/b6 domain-containing protein [Elusimicrobia bacterium]|jgi:thiosulfate reductase cytochrome b subunit|nr:cytochrome b/b6 domain-containing protein [Elusimicrobiota bacterium]MBK7544761.1 cytochrome b/b6 domain-containing protein [Elusimicrobiota bacterium]MBK7574274.1 cytochrome b/b6 domain-containing protein [Elusimicrobiota bacterium]MBK7688362.1 cytochrome b/b6 domain-containing protein [Elusimicrobiota bacterium]MBK8126420.1 cytochrome b/b6 domain-containing protein [Elusimicrobiota bacterium]